MPAPKPRRDETLINAPVRAHQWRRRIESGKAKSITDLAEHEGVTVAFEKKVSGVFSGGFFGPTSPRASRNRPPEIAQ